MSESTATHTNRLAAETSPYLLQHAHNPVDWYPWGPEALARAKAEDKPIFLSIGYAACHWCHVMERESFEDEATAAVLNAGFVSIKVDREERPDLDAIYMDAVQSMTGSGGWPMSVFLTPEGRPFYGGTYFPGEARYGMPSFRDVLGGVRRAWEEDREGVEGAGERLVRQIESAFQAGLGAGGGQSYSEATLETAANALSRDFDGAHGGWGGAPKFPQPMSVEFLLRRHVRTGDGRALAMARRTLDAMAAGGIYDHLGSGFARYATDAHWLVPHFEKMLYDNAQLARVYLHAFDLTHESLYGDVAAETLDYVLREMTLADGAFAASQDADTLGEEGVTYVWTLAEVTSVLGDDAALFAEAYDVTQGGNWEGHTILQRVQSDVELARAHGLEAEVVAARLRASRARLLQVRAARPQPARDDKALAAWNGLMIGAFAQAARSFSSDSYRVAAERAAELMLTSLRDESGGLRRSWKDGRASQSGVLEDYANLADGLLALYESTFEERWFVAARGLMDVVLERFADAEGGGFFDTSSDHEALIARPKSLQDNALPSGNAMAAFVLLRLAALTGEGSYRDAAERTLALVGPVAARYPTAFAQWLVAMDFALAPVVEVAIVGDREEAEPLLEVAFEGYRPHQVVALGSCAVGSAVPLLADRPMIDGRPTAYVCRTFVCERPVTDPAALRSRLTTVTTPP